MAILQSTNPTNHSKSKWLEDHKIALKKKSFSVSKSKLLYITGPDLVRVQKYFSIQFYNFFSRQFTMLEYFNWKEIKMPWKTSALKLDSRMVKSLQKAKDYHSKGKDILHPERCWLVFCWCSNRWKKIF